MKKKYNIVFLTGAGISAESGLETFRSFNSHDIDVNNNGTHNNKNSAGTWKKSGTWNKYYIEDVATPQAFQKNPYLVNGFYNKRRQEANNAKPNAAHYALAKLEEVWQGDFLIITQNVDDLHERSGSKNILHMHGNLNSVICLQCGEKHFWQDDVNDDSICPHCFSKKSLRPDIVFFGEMPYHMEQIEKALSKVDIFVVIGTSLQVRPAADFITYAKAVKAECLEFNLESCHNFYNDLENGFDRQFLGKATNTVPFFVDEIMTELSLFL